MTSARSTRSRAISRRRFGALALGAVGATATGAGPAAAKSRAEIDAGVLDALDELFRFRPAFQNLFQRAEGVLVVPDIIKAGFIVGAAYGEGALLVGGATESYWSYSSASLGFQAGAQRTRMALFIMEASELRRFRTGEVTELGAEAELTVIDGGLEFGIDTTMVNKPLVVAVFGRKGLLGGASFQGGKYSRLNL